MENSDYPDHLAKLKKNIAGELQKKSLAKSNSFESEDLSDDEYSYYSSSEESEEKKNDQPTARNNAKVELPQNAESFNHTTKDKDIVCFCCGKPGEYASDCKLRKEIAEKD